MDMNRENFLKLLTSKLSEGLTAKDQKLFDQACAANPEYRQIADGLLYQASNADALPQPQLQAVWQSIKEEEKSTTVPTMRRLWPRWLKAAAAVLLIIGTATILYLYKSPDNGASLSFNTSNQKLYKTLDDGSTICLNHNSNISYNANFGKTRREINLHGEAFFDVAKNAAIPLFIHVGQVTIRVKGTAFNVSEHLPGKQVEIALIRGKIEVSNVLNSQKIDLNPQQRLIVAVGKYQVLPLDTGRQEIALKWTRDSLVFKKEKLVNLAVLLERKYNVKIEIRNEKLKLKQFSGVIKKEQLTEALDALKLSFPFTYVVNNKVVTIK